MKRTFCDSCGSQIVDFRTIPREIDIPLQNKGEFATIPIGPTDWRNNDICLPCFINALQEWTPDKPSPIPAPSP